MLAALRARAAPAAGEVPDEIRAEALIAAQEIRDMRRPEERRPISSITCPECHGSMQEIVDGEFVRYRCHTGHAFTLEALGALQADAWERALYNAYRAQQERAMLVGRMADEARARGSGQPPPSSCSSGRKATRRAPTCCATFSPTAPARAARARTGSPEIADQLPLKEARRAAAAGGPRWRGARGHNHCCRPSYTNRIRGD